MFGEAQGSCPAAPTQQHTMKYHELLPAFPDLQKPHSSLPWRFPGQGGEVNLQREQSMRNQNPMHSPIFFGMRSRKQQISRWNCVLFQLRLRNLKNSSPFCPSLLFPSESVMVTGSIIMGKGDTSEECVTAQVMP